MKPAWLETKHIISEFNREPTNPGRSKDIDLTSEGGEADLDPNINFKNRLSDLLSNNGSFLSKSSNDNEESKTEERITESESLLHYMWRSFISYSKPEWLLNFA